MRLRDFSSGQNTVRGGWCAWGQGERHLNFLNFFLVRYPPLSLLLTALLRTWHHFFKRDPVTSPCVCFSFVQKWPLQARIATRWRRTFTEGRHFHHVHPTHPHLLLQSDFNFVNCYEGSLIAKRGGCQNPTVTRFLLSHFTAILCLTLDMQA